MSDKFVKYPANFGNMMPCIMIDRVGHTKKFDSVTDAAIFVVGKDGNIRSAVSAISRAIREDRLAYGLKWKRADEDE